MRFLSQKQFKVAKLLVGDTKDADFTILRQKRFYSPNMNIRIFGARTMTNINRKLKHGEAIFL